MEREKLIEKLKTIKDPRERDRIMWALAGIEKDMADDTSRPSMIKKDSAQPGSAKEAEKLPQLPPGIRGIFAYVVPGFLIFFGVINIIQAVMTILAGEPEHAIPQFIVGGMFLLFGIISLSKAKKQRKGMNAGQKKT